VTELDVLATVRRSVRGVLEGTPAFVQAAPDQRRELARRMVKVAMMGATLAADERDQTAKLARAAARTAPTAAAQEFGDAARSAGRTFQDIRQAIDFPTYVQSLITGVFQAITSSNLQQLTAIGDMLDAVSRTEDEFTSENIRDGDVIAWAVGKFPFLSRGEDGLQVADGVDIAEKTSEIAAQLRVPESEVSGLDDSDLLGTLGPLIRRRIGRERQQMLATLVQMGLQRVVVDEGRLHASMDMRVDTRSALAQQRARREETDVDVGVAGQVGMGMWGASAHTNVGYNQIQSEHATSREEIDTRAGLRSSVDLAFRTDQIPLDRMASRSQRARLDANSRVPVTVSDGNQSLLASDTGGGGSSGLPSTDRRITHSNRDADTAASAQREAQRREDAQRQEQRQDTQRQEQRQDTLHDRARREAREDRDAQRQPPPPQPQPPQPQAQPPQPQAPPPQPQAPPPQPQAPPPQPQAPRPPPQPQAPR
jgi:hypothetical protein